MAEAEPNGTEWSANQRKFMLWVATPIELREQRTVDDLAKHLGIGRTTLWRWRKIPGFNEHVQSYVKQHLGDALPEAIASLKEWARRGSFPHMKLYFEMIGMYTPKSEVNVTIRRAAEQMATEAGLDVGELIAEAERILTGVSS